MCIALPGRIVWVGAGRPAARPARIRVGDLEREVDLVMLPEARLGDWVIAHSGYAIRRLTEAAVEAWDRDVRLVGDQPVTAIRSSSDPTASAHRSTSLQLRKSP